MSLSPVQVTGAGNTATFTTAGGTGTLACTLPDLTAGHMVVVAIGAGDLPAGGGYIIESPVVTDSLGNTYTIEVWSNSGANSGGSPGFALATSVTGSASTVTFTFQFTVTSGAHFPASPYFAMTVAEYPALSSPIVQGTANTQVYGGPGNFPVNLSVTDSKGDIVTVSFGGTYGSGGPGPDVCMAIMDILASGTDYIFAMAFSYLSVLNTPTVSPTPYGTFALERTNFTPSPPAPEEIYFWDGALESNAVPPAWLVIREPQLGYTDRSQYLDFSASQVSDFQLILRKRGRATVPMVIKTQGDTYVPTMGSQLYLFEQIPAGFTDVFSGTIDDIILTYKDKLGRRIYTATAVSFDQCLDVILVPPQVFPAGSTAGSMITALFNANFAGAPIALGTIQTGATYGAPYVISDWTRMSQVLDQFASDSQYIWQVDMQALVLNFQLPNTTAAPFVLATNQIRFNSIKWRQKRQDYRNNQILNIAQSAFGQSSELFTGNGSANSWTLRRPPSEVTAAWITQNTQNTATGTFSGQPAVGDTITFSYPTAGSIYNWAPNSPYATGQIIIDPAGHIQKVTTQGTSGATIPTFSDTTQGGGTTTDGPGTPDPPPFNGAVIWTDQGISGGGLYDSVTYTFVQAAPNAAWAANTVYATNATIQSNGYIQKATTGGTSGASQPIFSGTPGGTVSDGGVVWTNENLCLDNTQWGQVVIGTTSSVTTQNLVDAIGAIFANAGNVFSWPTWENPLVNVGTITGPSFTIFNKAAGAGYVAALSKSCTNFSWSAAQTSGGVTQGPAYTLQIAQNGSSNTANVYYTPGSTTVALASINQSPVALPLSSPWQIQIQYTRLGGTSIVCERTDLVIQRAAIENGTGRYQAKVSDTNQINAFQGLLECQEALAAYDSLPVEFTFATLYPGLTPGQYLDISVSDVPTGVAALINGFYVVQEVRGKLLPTKPYMSQVTVPGGGHYEYTVMVINVGVIGSYLDFWQGLGGTGGGSSQSLVQLGSPGGGSLGGAPAGAGAVALPVTTKGDLLGYDTIPDRVPVGANGTVLTADSTQALGVKWGTALTNPMTAVGDIIVGGTAGAPNRLGIGSSGQVLQVSGGTPAWGTAGGTGLFAPLISIPTRAAFGFTNNLNQTGTFSQFDNVMGFSLSDTAGLGDHIEGIYSAYPSSPFTMTWLQASPTGWGVNTWAGLIVAASTTGKITGYCTNQNGGGSVFNYSAPNTFANTSVNGTSYSYPFIWLRYKDDGTNIYFYVSSDGVVWLQVFTVAKSSAYVVSFTYLGFALNAYSAPYSMTVMSLTQTFP